MFVFNPMLYWTPNVQVGLVMLEAQAVIAMRLMGMAGVWSVTPNENGLMVREKIHAVTRATIAANRVAMTGGKPDSIASAYVKPIRQKTRSNIKRLVKRGPKLKG